MQSLLKKKEDDERKALNISLLPKKKGFFKNYIILWASKWCEFARLSLFSAIPTSLVLVNVEALLVFNFSGIK